MNKEKNKTRGKISLLKRITEERCRRRKKRNISTRDRDRGDNATIGE